MYMNLKPNKHKRISFNTMTMASLGFIGLPKILGSPLNLAPPQIYFLLRSPHLFWSEIFRSPPTLNLRGAATMQIAQYCIIWDIPIDFLIMTWLSSIFLKILRITKA